MTATQTSTGTTRRGKAPAVPVDTYADFLAAKTRTAPTFGHEIAQEEINPILHTWQADIVQWAVKQGRAALWADTGLGKTFMQIEWARLSAERSLIVAPLAVCRQTEREAQKLGIDVRYVRTGVEADGPGIWITNYEMTPHFDPRTFGAVALDESSVLKDVTTKTRDRMIAEFAPVPRRLACTATPAPNDTAELANHAEFLGVSTQREMLSSYFLHDQDGWRVKGHARTPMFRWMSTWAIAIRRPSDMGYDDKGYDLPALNIRPHLLPVDVVPDGQFFATALGGVAGRAKIRRATLAARVARVADLVLAEPDEPWLLWCGLNDEAEALKARLPGAINVTGTWTPEAKAEALLGFADSDFPILITKPSIAAFGLNWQHCARMAFVGLNDSYEAYYQAIRRCWRYGQTRPVDVHIVLSDLEGQIAENVMRKEREAASTANELITQMSIARAA
jgi:hypothetical protein